jgi:hypothetical protein
MVAGRKVRKKKERKSDSARSEDHSMVIERSLTDRHLIMQMKRARQKTKWRRPVAAYLRRTTTSSDPPAATRQVATARTNSVTMILSRVITRLSYPYTVSALLCNDRQVN